jgi:hypothetical protein
MRQHQSHRHNSYVVILMATMHAKVRTGCEDKTLLMDNMCSWRQWRRQHLSGYATHRLYMQQWNLNFWFGVTSWNPRTAKYCEIPKMQVTDPQKALFTRKLKTLLHWVSLQPQLLRVFFIGIRYNSRLRMVGFNTSNELQVLMIRS